MNKVAVFGITGFSGRHFEQFVVDASLVREYRFFGFGRNVDRAIRSGQVDYRQGEACDPAQIHQFLSEVKPDYIVNLLGRFRAGNFAELVEINVGVTHSICSAVLQLKLPLAKILCVGSAAEYGGANPNPVSETAPTLPIGEYGLSKLYQTLLCDYFFRSGGLPIVLARTFNILGEGLSTDLSIGSFMQQIRSLPEGGTIRVGNLGTSRDFVHIREVCRCYWNLLLKGKPGEVYNVCSGQPRTIQSVLEGLIAVSGKKLSILVDPALVKKQDIESIYGDATKYNALMS